MGDSIDTGDCYPCPRTNLSPMSSTAQALYSEPTSGTPRPRQIFWARRFEISVWRGTASTVPVRGFDHNECAAPSRLR